MFEIQELSMLRLAQHAIFSFSPCSLSLVGKKQTSSQGLGLELSSLHASTWQRLMLHAAQAVRAMSKWLLQTLPAQVQHVAEAEYMT